MTHLKQGDKPEEMLKAVIRKAAKNGWNLPKDLYTDDQHFSILFSHSFAKAYWGEETTCFYCGKTCKKIKNDDGEFNISECCNEDCSFAWNYHLQQAVIATDPLIYYYERL